MESGRDRRIYHLIEVGSSLTVLIVSELLRFWFAVARDYAPLISQYELEAWLLRVSLICLAVHQSI